MIADTSYHKWCVNDTPVVGMSGPEGTEGEVAGTLHSRMVHIQALAGLVHILTLAGLVHTLTLAGLVHTLTLAGLVHTLTLAGLVHTLTLAGLVPHTQWVGTQSGKLGTQVDIHTVVEPRESIHLILLVL